MNTSLNGKKRKFKIYLTEEDSVKSEEKLIKDFLECLSQAGDSFSVDIIILEDIRPTVLFICMFLRFVKSLKKINCFVSLKCGRELKDLVFKLSLYGAVDSIEENGQ